MDDTIKSPAGVGGVNNGFGIPDAALAAVAETTASEIPQQASEQESPEQRRARLQAEADKLIAAEIDAEEIALMVAEARAKRAGANLPTDTEGFRKEYLHVQIFEGGQANDLPYVPLGINGFVIKVPRGVDVILPKEFVTECLQNAIQEITVKSQGGLVTRPVHRFPFNVKGPATEEQYREFQAKQRKLAGEQHMAKTVA